MKHGNCPCKSKKLDDNESCNGDTTDSDSEIEYTDVDFSNEEDDSTDYETEKQDFCSKISLTSNSLKPIYKECTAESINTVHGSVISVYF